MAAPQTNLFQILATLGSFFFGPPNLTPASIGLSTPTGFQNETYQTLMSGGVQRFFSINIPTSFNTEIEKQWPLIIDYHGDNGTPYKEYQNSQYYLYPQGQEYLVVYPLGVEQSWQGPSYAAPSVDDLQFTTDLVALLRTSYNIDPNRIYASGKSNGGGFVDLLACSDHGDQFAAFAMASAALYTDTHKSDCVKKRAIMESHGGKDTIIPYDGGEGKGGDLPDISAWIHWWGERDCGDGVTANITKFTGYNRTTYSCAGLNDIVVHYNVFDLGHCWPCSSGQNYDACPDTVLNYTPDVLNFFAAWNLTNAPKN